MTHPKAWKTKAAVNSLSQYKFEKNGLVQPTDLRERLRKRDMIDRVRTCPSRSQGVQKASKSQPKPIERREQK
jgi:hypothetical protein